MTLQPWPPAGPWLLPCSSESSASQGDQRALIQVCTGLGGLRRPRLVFFWHSFIFPEWSSIFWVWTKLPDIPEREDLRYSENKKHTTLVPGTLELLIKTQLWNPIQIQPRDNPPPNPICRESRSRWPGTLKVNIIGWARERLNGEASAPPRLAPLLHSSRKAKKLSWTNITLMHPVSHGLGGEEAAWPLSRQGWTNLTSV